MTNLPTKEQAASMSHYAVHAYVAGFRQDDNGKWFMPDYPDSPFFSNPKDALKWLTS